MMGSRRLASLCGFFFSAHVDAQLWKMHRSVGWPLARQGAPSERLRVSVAPMHFEEALETILRHARTGRKNCLALFNYDTTPFDRVAVQYRTFVGVLNTLTPPENFEKGSFVSFNGKLKGVPFSVIVTGGGPGLDVHDHSKGRKKNATNYPKFEHSAANQVLAAANLECNTLVVSHDSDFNDGHKRTYEQFISQNRAPLLKHIIFAVGENPIKSEAELLSNPQKLPAVDTHLDFESLALVDGKFYGHANRLPLAQSTKTPEDTASSSRSARRRRPIQTAV